MEGSQRDYADVAVSGGVAGAKKGLECSMNICRVGFASD
jgi:3-hydroxyisobutyrate dehydrogenase-like beta-hydroxyacid dehydrogenase